MDSLATNIGTSITKGFVIANFFAFFFGASWGSFLYTFILRYLDGTYSYSPLNALTLSSHCQHCRTSIKPLYLIPLVGYCIARGRCSVCGHGISPLYPLAEIVCGSVAVICIYTFSLSIALISFISITTAIGIAIIDSITMEIPNLLVFIIFVAGIFLCSIERQLLSHAYGAFFMLAVFIVPVLIKPKGFGIGDIKFAGAIGFILGLPVSIVALQIALITGAIYGIGYALLISKTLKAHIPFGPFLSLGLIISLMWGNDILLLYYSL